MHFLCKQCGLKRTVTEKFAGKTVVCPKCNAKTKLPDQLPTQVSKPGRSTIEEFIKKNTGKEKGPGIFELASEHLLAVNLKNRVWTKAGTIVAHQGDMKLTREGVLEPTGGVGGLLKKTVGADTGRLTKVEGRGSLYLADSGKQITILSLSNQTLFVNGNNLLAFEDSLRWHLKMMKKISGLAAGGLYNIKLEGTGLVAFTTHQAPFMLEIKGRPLLTDPNATVAWSANLEPEIKADLSLQTFLGRGNNESLQFVFDGDGFVVVQPCEEVSLQGG